MEIGASYAKSTLVFTGEILGLESGAFRFRVMKLYKGPAAPEVLVTVSMWDRGSYSPGDVALVFAETDGAFLSQKFIVPLCGRIRKLADAADDIRKLEAMPR